MVFGSPTFLPKTVVLGSELVLRNGLVIQSKQPREISFPLLFIILPQWLTSSFSWSRPNLKHALNKISSISLNNEGLYLFERAWFLLDNFHQKFTCLLQKQVIISFPSCINISIMVKSSHFTEAWIPMPSKYSTNCSCCSYAAPCRTRFKTCWNRM